MAYAFIYPKKDTNHAYQLVYKGLLWNSHYDFYLDITAFGKLEICIPQKGKQPVTSQCKSSADAHRLVERIKKLGIKRASLQNAKFPSDTGPKIRTDWDNIFAWLISNNQF